MATRITKKEKEALAIQGLKRCFKCQQSLPYDAFSKCHSKKDGHVARCKKCTSIRTNYQSCGPCGKCSIDINAPTTGSMGCWHCWMYRAHLKRLKRIEEEPERRHNSAIWQSQILLNKLKRIIKNGRFK